MALNVKMGGPVCLIMNSTDGKLEVNSDALEILSGISQPVVVVAVVGLYRTGKSYLMNKLAGVNRGFDLGATIEAKTKGIWMWCVRHPTKANCTLVLLDTEGLGDVEKGDKKNDIWIFCLALLLSSALVYNSMGTNDQDALDKLHLSTELTEKIKIKSKDNDDEEAEFSKHFPIFIWSVRDFTLKLEINGKLVTEDEYLENALKLKEPEKTNKDRQFNLPRKCMHMYFRTRKCFVFDRPAEKDILQRIDEVPDSELHTAFVAQVKTFCDFVFENAPVKELDGIHQVTGKMLGNMTKTYTETIRRGDVPCLENAVLAMCEIENTAAVQEASQYYKTNVKTRVEFPTDTMKQFMDVSGECEKEAIQIFMKRSFKDEERQFQRKLMGEIYKIKEDFLKQNETASIKYCQSLIKKHSVELEKALAEGSFSIPGGHQKFKDTMKKITASYNEEPKKGVQAEEVLQEFLKSKESIENTILKSDDALTEKQKEIEEEKAKAEAQEIERKVSEKRESQQKQKIDDQIKTVAENTEQLLEKLKMERQKHQHELERLMFEKRREQELLCHQGSYHQAKLYQAQIEDIQKERRESNDPEWYTPIIETFKSAAKVILPALINLGEQYVKEKRKNDQANKTTD
ncbi:guanylate-binding protein 1-like [Bombina bombina]|uniref:guanylate-binding protein 1-like n=1 Tax=Bombina bombina TaxID=8345 RepID=UPI00235AD54F|nr:guanylate-binding protein 1-like [Bombina bombina]